MPYHLELGSEGHSFHGKAIVVNSKSGMHLTLMPVDKDVAKVIKDQAEKDPAFIAGEREIAAEADKKVKALAGLRKVESDTKARNTKREAEAKTKGAERALSAIYKLVEQRIDSVLRGYGETSETDLSADNIRYLKHHTIGDYGKLNDAIYELGEKHNIHLGSELDEHAEAYWRKEVKKKMKKPEARKGNFDALKDTFQALKTQTENVVKEGIEMSKGKTNFIGKIKIINKLATLYTSYNALMTKMNKMPEYSDWRAENTWEFLSNIPYNFTKMVKAKADVKDAKDEHSGT
jgi:hypothetical protein